MEFTAGILLEQKDLSIKTIAAECLAGGVHNWCFPLENHPGEMSLSRLFFCHISGNGLFNSGQNNVYWLSKVQDQLAFFWIYY